MDKKFNFIENSGVHISDIKDYIFRVLSNWKWFVLSIAIALGFAYYKNISTQKIYGLSTTIEVKEKQNPLFSSGTNIALNWGGVSDKVESIKKALTSRTHNEKVIRELNYYVDYLKEGSFRKEDVYGQTPFKLILQPNQHQLLNSLFKIEFTSETSYELSIESEENQIFTLLNYNDETIKKYKFDTQKFSQNYSFDEFINLPFLKGQVKIEKQSNEKIKGTVYYFKLNAINTTTSKYQNVRAKGLQGTSLVELSLTGTNKNRIVDFLNKTVEVLAKYELDQKTNYAYSTKEFIDAQFKNTSDTLKLIENNIENFKQNNSIYNLSAQGGEIFSKTISLDQTQKNLEDRIEYFNNLETYIKNNDNYSKIPAPAIINIEDASISSMVSKLTELSIENDKLSNDVTNKHPSLKLIQQKIETAKTVLLENLASLKDNTEQSLKRSKSRLSGYTNQLSELPNKEQKLLNYQRKYSLTESNFVFLMQKKYVAEIAIAASVSDISVLDSAKDTGQGFILPRISFNYMVALLLGIILPLFVIIAKELLDTKIRTAEDLERISPIPILGVVGSNLLENNLAVFLKPKSTVSESFRALRSNIQFLFDRSKIGESKTILVTSSVSGEGKTFASINMATVFALGGKKTVLLGLDLRKPKIFGDFEISNEIGVVNYLIGEENIANIINKTKIPNLDIITSGPIPPNPSELIINTATHELIEHLKQTYDYIIIDTPPIGLVSDAIELIKYADTTMYIVRQGYSHRGMLKMINQKYLKEEISKVSLVLNDFKIKSKYGYGYGYGYGAYGKYSNGYHENSKPTSFIKRIFNKKP